jgi:hypothetical protein
MSEFSDAAKAKLFRANDTSLRLQFATPADKRKFVEDITNYMECEVAAELQGFTPILPVGRLRDLIEQMHNSLHWREYLRKLLA